MQDYELLSDGRFVVRDYNRKKPFSNFLPGIAGLHGIPMWVFYANRGQGVASFGTRDKDRAILEFFPANKAYQNINRLGFRTFLKISARHGETVFYEPFQEPSAAAVYFPKQTLEISSHEFVVRETHKVLGLEIAVRYFTLPGEPLAALIRELTISNISPGSLSLEFLDGLPCVNPYGMNEFFIKNMSRTIEAWMTAGNVERSAPFLRLRVDATDRPEVVEIKGGHFFFGFVEEKSKRAPLLEPIVDPAVVFGSRLDFGEPKLFYQNGGFKPSAQITENRTPCALVRASFHLAPGQSKTTASFFGQSDSVECVNRFAARARTAGFVGEKSEENRRLIEGIKSRMGTVTASFAFDQYCGQTYLDNVLRGGTPLIFEEDGRRDVFYVYSRKHGDLERDYNRFVVEPTYYSQGNGNYRDVNQNRRHDVWFFPGVRDANIKTFLNLLQLDGYNPLVVKGALYRASKKNEIKKVLARFLGKKGEAASWEVLSHAFSPGEFCRFLESRGFLKRSAFEKLWEALWPCLSREEQAEHGEGYWIDHWTYNLDLIESYLAIYPEDRRSLIFGRREYTFFDDEHCVRPRVQKYHQAGGVVRQYEAVGRDKEKARLVQTRREEPHAVRTGHGRGAVYRTTLFVKLLCLFANKFSSLDAEGMGIEMEANKPSWYDALNGLPGLFGSSLGETFELKRLCLFLIHGFEENGASLEEPFFLPEELSLFVAKLEGALQDYFLHRKDKGAHPAFWKTASSAREAFRQATFWGLSGRERKATFGSIKIFLEHAREKIDIGLERAYHPETKLYPTYFENHAVSFRALKGAKRGIEVTRFEQRVLPYFLEGPVHAMKVERDPLRKKTLYQAVRKSALYDTKLGMYRVNASLKGAPLEIGRARIFSPGWLENESVWLHMEYKWLLELLRSGLTDEFFADFKKALVPFQPAERYGRSILENSSFIASSAFPDPSLHGTGFVARLSGSTAEFLSMWLCMNVGKTPFFLGLDGKLSLRFQPTLPAFLFTQTETTRRFLDADGQERKIGIPKDCLAFLFLGKTLVVYHNPRRLDTFGKMRVAAKKVTLKSSSGATTFSSDTIPSPYAARVRDGFVPRIDIELA